MTTVSPRLTRCTQVTDLSNEYLLEHQTYTVGRSPDRDIVLHADFVSSMHAEIIYDNDRYSIIDKSRNGVWVNKTKIAPGYSVPLPHEAIVGLGENRSDFQYWNDQQTADRSETITLAHSGSSVLIMRGKRVFLRGTPIKLTMQELTMFNYMYEHVNEILDSMELVKEIYGEKAEAYYGKEEIHKTINRLRVKLGDVKKEIIINERGIGYRLCLPES